MSPTLDRVRVHPTAIVEDDVAVGDGSAIWDNVHIRRGARIGKQCIVGEKTYVAYGVRIGDFCKLNAAVYVCAEVTLEDGVMVGAHSVFTNDRFPRAATPDLQALRPSEPDDATLSTRVCAGATIGANATIGPGITIGKFAMVGMGSVVTRDIAEFHLVAGNPARTIGAVCRCGAVVTRFEAQHEQEEETVACPDCRRRYTVVARTVSEA